VPDVSFWIAKQQAGVSIDHFVQTHLLYHRCP
jgi:hypothetical protein